MSITEAPGSELSTPNPIPQKNVGAGSGHRSVLQDLQNRRNTRRRRHTPPPAWMVRCVAQISALANWAWFRLPEHLGARRHEFVTAAASFLVHLFLGLMLAAWMLPSESAEDWFSTLTARRSDLDETQVLQLDDIVQPEQIVDLDVDSSIKQMLSELEDGLATHEVDVPLDRNFSLPIDDLTTLQEVPVLKGEFGGRSTAGRRQAVKKFGGTAESEMAVMSGLRWLESIQLKDGSWSFGKIGAADSPGTLVSTNMGATSMAMLCFLGAGHTHLSGGPFHDTVKKGMAWIHESAVTGSFGADLRGNYQGNSGMYIQGIATIVVCEAAAMEPDDRQLRRLAMGAVAFIERSQDPFGGGWRYQPREPGDTSVTGWQIMALQSAKAGRIRVDDRSFRDARNFLTSVETGGGAFYGYTKPQANRDSMTAVGLLCRMYLGWKRNHDGLRRGVQHLSRVGPSRDDIYYNYYATQVMHHWGGDEWSKWNERMREQLIDTQVQNGPASGSWNVTDPHGSAGGRIYQTALSILTLEVYYRHLPLYRRLDHLSEDDEAANKAVGN
jgi:hypothetical protein